MATQAFPTQGPVARSSTVMARGSGGAPFAATTKSVDEEVVLSGVSGGLILLPLTMAPALVVPDFEISEGESFTHAWLKVVWDAGYAVVAESTVIEGGTAWPEQAFNVAEKCTYIPIAWIAEEKVAQVVTSNIMLHRVIVTGGFILAPAAL